MGGNKYKSPRAGMMHCMGMKAGEGAKTATHLKLIIIVLLIHVGQLRLYRLVRSKNLAPLALLKRVSDLLDGLSWMTPQWYHWMGGEATGGWSERKGQAAQMCAQSPSWTFHFVATVHKGECTFAYRSYAGPISH